jgi:hypothetical integral membrane protein (TIGR02206 family)
MGFPKKRKPIFPFIHSSSTKKEQSIHGGMIQSSLAMIGGSHGDFFNWAQSPATLCERMIGMKQFFAFWPDIPPGEAFPFLGIKHLIGMATVGLLIYAALSHMLGQSREKNDRIIKLAALAIPVVEFARILWMVGLGETNWVKLLPLHLCGTQVFFIPLAVFTGWGCLKEFIFYTGILGGVVAILYPVGIVDTYPYFHFQTLQSLTLHGLLLFVPLAMVLFQGFRPSLKKFWQVPAVLMVPASLAFLVDFTFGENYMFLYSAPPGTPLVWIFDAFGHGAYLMVMFLGVMLACLLIYGVFVAMDHRSMWAFGEQKEPVTIGSDR